MLLFLSPMFLVEFSALSSISCFSFQFCLHFWDSLSTFFLNLPAHTASHSLTSHFSFFWCCILFLWSPSKELLLFLIIIYGEIFYHNFHLPWGLIFLVTLFMNKGYYTFFFLSLMLCVFFLYYSSLREVDFLD